MEQKNYTLAQLLASYAADHTIVVRVEPGFAVEFTDRKGLQVKTVASELEAVIPTAQHRTDVVKRLYKMRFTPVSTIADGAATKFVAAVSDTKVYVTVMKVPGSSESLAPCVTVDLTAAEVTPTVKESPVAANEDIFVESHKADAEATKQKGALETFFSWVRKIFL